MTAECAHLVRLCRGPLLPPQSNLAAHTPRVPLSTWRHTPPCGDGRPSAPLAGSVTTELRTETMCVLP